MRRTLYLAALTAALAAGVAGGVPEASGQYIVRGTKKGNWADVSCGASSGSPTQMAPRRADRVSFVIVNDSAAGVYVGGDTGTTALTGSNAVLLPAGQTMSDSLPGVWVGELRCQSADTTARTVRFMEVRQ